MGCLLLRTKKGNNHSAEFQTITTTFISSLPCGNASSLCLITMLVNLAHQWWFSMHDHLATYLLTTLHHSSCLQLVADHLSKDFDALFIGVLCIT